MRAHSVAGPLTPQPPAPNPVGCPRGPARAPYHAPVNIHRASAALEKLRRQRHKPANPPTIGTDVAAFATDLARRHKSLGGVAAAWSRAVPADFSAAELVSLSRGVLTVRVEAAPLRYRLDRFLRAGGEREVQKLSPVTLKKIRLTG